MLPTIKDLNYFKQGGYKVHKKSARMTSRRLSSVSKRRGGFKVVKKPKSKGGTKKKRTIKKKVP